MDAKLKKKLTSSLIHAAKIGVGSSIAIYIATLMQLQFATSAGIITLLTLLTTKIETLRLSLYRLLSFIFSMGIAMIMTNQGMSIWVLYGVYIFFVVFFSNWLGWFATISVNAVIGTHFLSTLDFSLDFLLNEFLLVIIGVAIAILFNAFTSSNRLEQRLIHNIEYTERRLDHILEDLTKYLKKEKVERNVWDNVIELESFIEHFIEQSYEFQNNTFKKDKDYYVHYFEMRSSQCQVLHNLHYNIKEIRHKPKEALVVAGYIIYIRQFIFDIVDPEEQIEILEEMFTAMKREALPTTQAQLEARVNLYHILMDIEEFLVFKRRFVRSIGEQASGIDIDEYVKS